MNKDLTDIILVLDRSGSMQSIAGDTIGGVNRFIDDQKAASGRATFTLNQFDHEFERVVSTQDITGVKHLTDTTFIPRGGTALYDAIGRSINETGARLAAMPETERPAHVVFVIMTDGFENSSREFTFNRIKEMITHQREKYGWEFVYLGANQDAMAVGAGMGISPGNSMSYAANAIGTSNAFVSTSHNLVQMRAGVARSMVYSTADRAAQKAAGINQ